MLNGGLYAHLSLELGSSAHELPFTNQEIALLIRTIRYRNRLNYQFDNLLSAIPARLIAESEGSIGGPDDRREKRVNKAEVLILAKRHIEELERKQWEFKAENRRLAARVKEFEEAWTRAGGNPLMP